MYFSSTPQPRINRHPQVDNLSAGADQVLLVGAPWRASLGATEPGHQFVVGGAFALALKENKDI